MGKCTCLDGWDKTLCVDPFHAFNVINSFKVALNIQPADVCLYYHYHRDSVFVMHFSCWFTTEALGWSKTSKNLRDRSFESRVEVCLQDLNFFKKYLQSWGEMFLVQKDSKFPYLSHTRLPKSSWFPVNGGGRRKQQLMGQCEGAGSRDVEPGAGWVLLQLSPALLITVFYSIFKTCVTRWRVVKEIRVSLKLCLTCWRVSVF